ncbi:MAG: Gfo/Idh/MocA family oxidoreductase, partial [Ruthenibacterium sp.]
MHILIVGLGSMGKRRARLICGVDKSIIVSGVDSTESRRAEAQALGIVPYDSIAQAVAAQRFDAAFVCTAPVTHAGIIDALLDANLPVFTELNLVADGYDALIAKAKANHLPLFLSSTMLYRAETQYIKAQVTAFAKPVNYIYHIGQYLPDWHPWESYKNFFVGDKRTSGVREIFGIDLPWLLDAFGEVVRVSVEKDKLSALELDYPDTYFVTLRHKNGTKGFL